MDGRGGCGRAIWLQWVFWWWLCGGSMGMEISGTEDLGAAKKHAWQGCGSAAPWLELARCDTDVSYPWAEGFPHHEGRSSWALGRNKGPWFEGSPHHEGRLCEVLGCSIAVEEVRGAELRGGTYCGAGKCGIIEVGAPRPQVHGNNRVLGGPLGKELMVTVDGSREALFWKTCGCQCGGDTLYKVGGIRSDVQKPGKVAAD